MNVIVIPAFLDEPSIAGILACQAAQACHSEEEGHYVDYDHLVRDTERRKEEEAREKDKSIKPPKQPKPPTKEGRTFKAIKPFHMDWLAGLIQKQVGDLGRVDPDMQVYRLRKGSAVGAHRDEDFTDLRGRVARWSVLLKLNAGYQGGETRFLGDFTPDIPVGGGVVFPHATLHEGLVCLAGEKWLVKTDLFT